MGANSLVMAEPSLDHDERHGENDLILFDATKAS